MIDGDWDRRNLESAGFVGWQRWGEWPPPQTSLSPSAGGVYVLYRESLGEPNFLARSTGGTHKKRNPSVTREALLANWVPGANVVYIGKGDHGRLLDRLTEYRNMGTRSSGSHWGGRLIWHLPDSGELLIAYQVLASTVVPREVERHMLDDFRRRYGKPPFANDPHRLGN